MLSKKNQNKAFVYEEEFNQKNEYHEKKNLDNKNLIIIIENKEYILDSEYSKLLSNFTKNISQLDSKVKKYF